MKLFITIALIAVLRTVDAQQPQPLNQFSSEQLREFLKGYSGDWRKDTDQSKGVPEPKRAPRPSELIGLPKIDEDKSPRVSLVDVLRDRRSRREFTDEAMSLQHLSFLLWCTQGETGDNEPGGGLRTAPSGGGRYPIDTYVAVSRVQGLEPGIYRYLAEEHALGVVKRQPDISGQLRAACYRQEVMQQAAAVFAWVAVPYRTEWKYGYLAPRMIAIEAGHLCQNLYLAVEAIHWGTCAMLAYDQHRMDTLFALDGKDQFVLYLAPVGKVE